LRSAPASFTAAPLPGTGGILLVNPIYRASLPKGVLADPAKARLVDMIGSTWCISPRHHRPHQPLMIARLLGNKGRGIWLEAAVRLLAQGVVARFLRSPVLR
jgi:hypothetical protein